MTADDRPSPGANRTASPAARAPRWMRVTLVVSLALNLAVVGVVAGSYFGRRPADGISPPRDAASALYLRAMPHDHHQALEDGMRREGGRFRVDRAALRAELAETLQALRAEPFDPSAFAERIARQRQALSDRVSAGDQLLVERLAAMTPDERQAYADRLERNFGRIARWRRD